MLKLIDDKLNRNEFITSLFKIFETFGNQNGRGLTMVINGKYGSGKTTLLNFIEEENEKEKKYNVIKYNSWENNIFNNPLIPILHTISKLKNQNSKIKNGAKKILKNFPKIFFSTLANVHNLDLTSLCSNENIFDEYDSFNKALEEFKTILTNYCIDKKTVLLVDELDRCLPEYQIKVLESLYHLLDIPNLIVVIALDKQQLECSIKSKFGEQQNTYGYLAKFIQYEIDLPTANCYEYIKQLMTFTTNQDNEDEVKNLISLMFKANEISIRECQIILNEINLVCNEIDNKGEPIVYLYWYPILVSLILLIKKINPDIYKKHFYTQREQIFEFPQEHIDLNDTPYKTFLDDIKNTPIQKILNIILSNNYGQCFMLHFINTFYPIRNISQESIANYIKRDVETIHSITYAYGEKMAHYPNLINNLIEKIKILI